MTSAEELTSQGSLELSAAGSVCSASVELALSRRIGELLGDLLALEAVLPYPLCRFAD